MSIVAMFGGALVGGGLWVLITGMTRRRSPSLEALRAHGSPGARADGSSEVDSSDIHIKSIPPKGVRPKLLVLAERLLSPKAAPAKDTISQTTFSKTRKAKAQTAKNQALRICQTSSAEHALAKLSAGLLWAVAPPLFIFIVNFAGFSIPLWWGLPSMLVGAVAGFMLVDRQLLEKAEKEKTAFRSAIVAYLDLVKILLAGGSHTDGALYQAAVSGQGRVFEEIRAVLDWSRVQGLSFAEGLNRLSEDVGLKELAEISATVSLAEAEGASPSEALSRKAESAASKELAEAQAYANALTERMSMPTVLLAFVFVIFIAFPALSSLSNAL